ncbi:hypothetical protein [Nocardia acidivorans]|uniref:hypothetical protein n=1 Tax=Nocardia acidivorans TaxID=404580 RepID=UPI00082AF2D0|nr:hypothetical protein [Nocardia acidivorans]
MNPEQIAALSAGAVAVLGALFGYLDRRQSRRADEQARQIAELQDRVGHLEDELAQSKSLFGESVRFIRILLAHIRDLGIAHQFGTPPPPTPEIPDRLREEV